MAKSSKPDLNTVKNDHRIKMMLEAAGRQMEELGYTEHGARHAMIVATRARDILLEFEYPERLAELAAIAAYLHDVGNLVGRNQHANIAALIVYPVLIDLGFDYEETFQIMGSIASHEDEDGTATNAMDAAVVIADKSDVHRTRVREWDPLTHDIHDRVNYATTRRQVLVDPKAMTITIDLTIDTSFSPVIEYCEIFLDRMKMVQQAAEFLGCHFKLVINDTEFS